MLDWLIFCLEILLYAEIISFVFLAIFARELFRSTYAAIDPNEDPQIQIMIDDALSQIIICDNPKKDLTFVVITNILREWKRRSF